MQICQEMVFSSDFSSKKSLASWLLLASNAVDFREFVIPPLWGGGNTTPLKTTAALADRPKHLMTSQVTRCGSGTLQSQDFIEAQQYFFLVYYYLLYALPYGGNYKNEEKCLRVNTKISKQYLNQCFGKTKWFNYF